MLLPSLDFFWRFFIRVLLFLLYELIFQIIDFSNNIKMGLCLSILILPGGERERKRERECVWK